MDFALGSLLWVVPLHNPATLYPPRLWSIVGCQLYWCLDPLAALQGPWILHASKILLWVHPFCTRFCEILRNIKSLAGFDGLHMFVKQSFLLGHIPYTSLYLPFSCHSRNILSDSCDAQHPRDNLSYFGPIAGRECLVPIGARSQLQPSVHIHIPCGFRYPLMLHPKRSNQAFLVPQNLRS